MYNIRKRKLNETQNMKFNDRCQTYFNLLEQPQIKALIRRDKCKMIADKYILANIFILFKRAKFFEHEYTIRNFYIALYFVHDVQEDIEELKDDIISSYLGPRREFQRSYCEDFLHDRFLFFQRINYNGIVSKGVCDRLVRKAPHWAWKRIRDSSHAGVYYKFIECENCELFYV